MAWTQETGIPAGDTSRTITGLNPDTQYEWRIIAVGDGVSYLDSDPSAIQSVITDAAVAAAFAGGSETMAATLSATEDKTQALVFALSGGTITTGADASLLADGDMISSTTFDFSSTFATAASSAMAIDDDHIYMIVFEDWVSNSPHKLFRMSRSDLTATPVELALPSNLDTSQVLGGMARNGDYLYIIPLEYQSTAHRLDVTDADAAWEDITLSPLRSYIRSIIGGADATEFFLFDTDFGSSNRKLYRYTLSGTTLSNDTGFTGAGISLSVRGGAYDAGNDQVIGIVDGSTNSVIRYNAATGAKHSDAFNLPNASAANQYAQGADFDNGILYVLWSQGPATTTRTGEIIVRAYYTE